MMGSSATEVERLIQAARLHLAQGELHEAAGRATEAIRMDGQQAAAYLVRAEAHRRLKRAERALADLAVAIRLDPQQPGPYVIRAEILKRRCLLDQAIADATSALLLDPRNAAAYAIRAQCRYAIGDHEGAREDVQEMLLIDPTRPIPELRARESSAPSPATAADDERFWKQAGGGNREDERALFADGKPVDRTYRSRPAVSDEDAPEALGVASGYKPEVIPGPLPRMRGRAKRSLGHGGGGAIVMLGAATVAGFALWLVFRGTPGPEPSTRSANLKSSSVVESNAPPPQLASATPGAAETTRRGASAPARPLDLKPVVRDLGSFSLTQDGRTWVVVMPERFTRAELAFYRGTTDDLTLNAAWAGHLQINDRDVVRFTDAENRKRTFVFHDYTSGMDYREENDYKKKPLRRYIDVTKYLKPGENSFHYYHEQRPDLPMGVVLAITTATAETDVPPQLAPIRSEAAPEIVSLTEINTAKRDFCPWLSPGGLTIYWVTDTPSDPEGEIWTARRKGPGSLFADKRQVGYGRHIAVSADGLTMLLVARRADGRPGTSIQVARRPSTDETFGRPQEIPEWRSIESPRNLFLSADGRTLMFCDGPFTTAGFRLMMMTRGSPDARWGQPHPVPAALGRGVQGLMTGPHLSADGRMLLCALEQPSDRPLVRFMACSRNTPDEPFSRPVFLDLPEVHEFFGWMPRYVEATHELFFCSNRLTSAGDLDLWMVRNFEAPGLDQRSP